MSILPDYIKTEWKTLNHNRLFFADPNLSKNCAKKASQKPLVPGSLNGCIECSFSSLNVWEYQSSVQQIIPSRIYENLEYYEDGTHYNDQEQFNGMVKKIPPGISSYYWNLWEQWSSSVLLEYIKLGWVNRFKNICSEDVINWYTSRIESLPGILPQIEYCLNLPLKNEALFLSKSLQIDADFIDKQDFSNENYIDLFQEFSELRQWAHFYIFLKQFSVEPTEELKEIFQTYEILEEPKFDVHEFVDLVSDPVREAYQSRFKGETNSDCKVNGIEDHHDAISNHIVNGILVPNGDLNEQVNGTEESLDGNLQPDNESSEPSADLDHDFVSIEDLSTDSVPVLTEDFGEPGVDSIEFKNFKITPPKKTKRTFELFPSNVYPADMDLAKLEAEVGPIEGMELEKVGNIKFSDPEKEYAISEQLRKGGRIFGNAWKSAKKDKDLSENGDGPKKDKDLSENGDGPKKDTTSESSCSVSPLPKSNNSTGVAWALGHLKILNHDTKTDQPFKFGTEDVPSSVPFMPSFQEDSKLAHDEELIVDTGRSSLKRKHDQDDTPSADHVKDEPSSKSLSLLTNFSSNVMVLFSFVFKAFFKLSTTLLYPFSFVLRPFYTGINNIRKNRARRTKKEQKELVITNVFKNRIKPLLKVFPEGKIINDVVLFEVGKGSKARHIREELVHNCMTYKEDKPSLISTYLIEEDCDDILDHLNYVPMVNENSDDIKTHTIYDDEGNEQKVVKVSVDDDAKKRILDAHAEMSTSPEEPLPALSKLSESHVTFDENGFPQLIKGELIYKEINMHFKIKKILKYATPMKPPLEKNRGSVPEGISSRVKKYWHQRYRLFLKYDEGIKLDTESWYSVTPEILASHQAERCRCDVVVDAFCGAGGNAIQLAATCNHVVAIDKDPEKIAMARHNANIYGVADRIEFIVGDFFDVAPNLQADVVMLSPPWGGVSYHISEFYDIFKMGGDVDGKKLFKTASEISKNIAIYLPRNSNVYQIIELAMYGDGMVDIEYAHMSNKRKGLTAYYGELAPFGYQ